MNDIEKQEKIKVLEEEKNALILEIEQLKFKFHLNRLLYHPNTLTSKDV